MMMTEKDFVEKMHKGMSGRILEGSVNDFLEKLSEEFLIEAPTELIPESLEEPLNKMRGISKISVEGILEEFLKDFFLNNLWESS